MKYDVFVSYSHRDAEWVRASLLIELERRNFKVCIDFRDFVGGSLSVEEMQRAVLESRRVLIVLSKDYLTSEWTKFENAMAQTLDPGALNRKLIPILKENCQIPLRLEILHHRNLIDNDKNEWELLFRDLA